jgi:formylglycine-generating enzyme required for sulfatase activity
MSADRDKRLAQLKQAYESGILDEDTYRAAVAALDASAVVTNTGSGALAQDQGVAAGAGGVAVGTQYGDIYQLPAEKPTTPEGLRIAYLGWLLAQTRAVPLAGVDRKSISEETRRDLDLAAVYTALMTRRPEVEGHESKSAPRDVLLERESRLLSALEVLNKEHHLALLGDPGSGKSTFVNFVALCMAGQLAGHPQANLRLLTTPLPGEKGRERGKAQAQPWDHGALLPVRVILREFVARGLAQAAGRVGGDTLWRFIVDELPETLREFGKLLRAEWLEKGGLLLLDGLDEVPEADQRREQIKIVVQDFAAAFPRVRVLVTSRTYAYQKQAWKLDGFAEAVLAPFSPAQIRKFVEQWYAYVGPARRLSPEDAQGRAVQLNHAIERSPRLQELAARPLLLTLMASLHAWRGGALPEQREELYADAVELLLDQWENQKLRRKADGTYELLQPGLAEWLNIDQKAVRALLNRLAFEAHRDQPDLRGTADIPQTKLVGEMMALNLNPDARPARLEEYLRDRAGLLEPRGVGIYAFPHRTLQEYLAACHLTDHGFPDDVAALLRAEPNRWREAALLAGAKAARGTASAAWTLADALCYEPLAAASLPLPEPAAWGALLAAQVLIENNSLSNVTERNQRKVDLIRDWLVAIVTRGALAPIDGAQAGDALAVLGDPRDFDELVVVPAGKFIMGSDKQRDLDAFDSEFPQNEVQVGDFRIGKYAVTVGQWRRFVEAAGYESHAYALSRPANHPVTVVSWHDARAYCEWLMAEWREMGKIGPEDVVRLPTEAEWEKAARGTDGRLWPWEGDYDPLKANVSETGIGHTCAVGSFPNGCSPYGALDMIGNVWEWTLSKFKEYPYAARDGREAEDKSDDPRVLRGGAFVNNRRFARCAFRFTYHPDYRYDNLGFRVCVVSPA